eukprot:COSAG05_NODE_22961_length_261_cov_0.635802_1_plen_34_part_10
MLTAASLGRVHLHIRILRTRRRVLHKGRLARGVW